MAKAAAKKALVNIMLTEDVETEEIVLKEDRIGLFDRQGISGSQRLTRE